ncbi:MAG: glycoside hydrolase family 3 C-terminal domain-containing protein [Chitinispirillales bacterium]|jgi:beta-glucosidase|nr:glycoside hydrolase family 3 C-terminal domain-containing protein [Chitinispirillales bacterium]
MTLSKTRAALAFLYLAPIAIATQAFGAVTLTGKVTDGQGNALQNAVVMIKAGGNLIASARALTDAQGNFGQFKSAAIEVAGIGETLLVVKKAGYLPKTVNYSEISGGNAGTVVLESDPLERRIDSVMSLMNLAEKIAQMTQPELSSGPFSNGVSTPNSGTSYLYGSVLNGGSGYSSTFLNTVTTTLNGWPAGRARIPTSYGKDAVHGNAGVAGYTVFPHNIGLGAARDSALVRRIGEATAKELWAAGIDLNFSPAISVVRDARWGRSYESYGETAELAAQMGAAMVRGLQGERYNAPWRITATAKHFLGDGGTTDGKDRGNTAATDDQLRAIHLPGYEAVVEQGVLSVMASFNQINTVHQHIDSTRLTGWLKTELGFDGYIISDWQGIANSNQPGFTSPDGYGPGANQGPSLTKEAVRKAVNAGIDLAMEPGSHTSFMKYLDTLVSSGAVSQERINDAVRRILRAKFRAGRMDNVAGPSEYAGKTANKNSAEHRAIAREAVRKSQVLLKNDNSALPLSKNGVKIHVFGSHHNNIGLQCGGWTINWQGDTTNAAFSGVGASSISKGMQEVAPGANLSAAAGDADVIVYVTGERPYAEWNGDLTSLDFNPPAADMTNLANYRSQGKKIVTVFVTGRPRIVTQLLQASDAFLVAWLPGTEGGGVADILFGSAITGTLPVTWPGANGAQFQYGFGLNYLKTPAAPNAPTLASKSHNSVTLTPNAAYEFSIDSAAWLRSNEFTDLTAETEYTFYQRVAATDTTTASASSPGLKVTTDNEPIISIAIQDREIPSAKTDNIVIIQPLSAAAINDLSAGPNPVLLRSGGVKFFWHGGVIKGGSLNIYDAFGNFIKKININDKSAGESGERAVAQWDFTDRKGRIVPDGGYLVKGIVVGRDGKDKKVSFILGVR